MPPTPRSRRRRSSRGAAALEAALVTPLIMLLIFGIIEFALVMKDNLALTSAIRVGGRIASANPGAGPGTATEAGDCGTSCDGNNTPLFARFAADAIARSGTALPKDSINELWIFKANKFGYPGDDSNTTWTCSTNCVVYKWVPAKSQFRYTSGTWQSKTINACPNASDGVGVYMTANHKWLTGLFGGTALLADNATFQFEPLPPGGCSGNGTDHR